VEVGEVVVIKANAGQRYEGEDVETVNGVPIVPRGYRGIWRTPLTPQLYYVHPKALVPTRVRTTNRIYSYTAKSTGMRSNAIGVRSKDGFEFPVDVRVSVKINAENAPYCVALLKDPDSDPDRDGYDILEERVVLPSIRAIFRNSAEQRDALEYVNTRSEIEQAATGSFAQQLEAFRVDTDGVFVADIGLSSTDQGKKLLATQTDKEIAIREKETWQRKMEAEQERAKTVKAEEEANQEKLKAEARAQVDINKSLAEAAIVEAEGQKEVYLKKIEALDGVDNFVRIELAKLILDGLKNVDLPDVMVLSGADAGDGSSAMDALVARMLQEQQKKNE
jgi:regulator of protease activity HflC (stomatin/prohibitin superfamily)